MKLAYIIPTRDRPQVLQQTLDALGALPRHDAQVVIADNASAVRPALPGALRNGLPVDLVPLRTNAGAAARNAAVMVSDPACEWVVMLDDDSAPLSIGHVPVLEAAQSGISAVAAEIWLPDRIDDTLPVEHTTFGGRPTVAGKRIRTRESGGLPEVFIGCGVAIRRAAFLDCGGYDHTFGFYAEEYDLAARLMRAGGRIEMDRRFQVLHRKVTSGRDMDLILQRLVRNNGWVTQRYAPARRRVRELAHVIERYGSIARKEHAERGYTAGLGELIETLRSQRRSPLTKPLWDRFTGKSVALASLERAWIKRGFRTAAIVDEGKNVGVIREALQELGVREVAPDQTNTLIVGTLSPGPMLDAWERRRRDGRVICPWELVGTEAPSIAA